MNLVAQFEETSDYLNDISFVSSTTGWAVGELHWDQPSKTYLGTILNTTDGGLTWNPQPDGVNVSLQAVDFVDANIGWAVGAEGTILHTANGGAHWDLQTIATTDDLRSLIFTDPNMGWATTIRTIHYNGYGDADNWVSNIWHTPDGGTTWLQQTLPAGASILHSIDFVDNQRGWAVGMKYTGGNDTYGNPQHIGMIYHTTDGGQTWSEEFNLVLPVSLTSVTFVDSLNGWACGFPTDSASTVGEIYHTKDGGQTWTSQLDGDFDAPLWKIRFINQNEGYAVGFDYISAWGPPVWRTLDGGVTWKEIYMAQQEFGDDGLYGLAVLPDRVVAVGDRDFVAISTDPWGNYNWPSGDQLFTQSFFNIHYTFNDVVFTDANNGWAAGSRTYAPGVSGQVILHTADGGNTWETQLEQEPSVSAGVGFIQINRLAFTDSQYGWAVGDSDQLHGAIYHTTDGGQHWAEQGQDLYGGHDLKFLDLNFQDRQNGWALASYQPNILTLALIHTTNGGTTWTWVDTGIQDSDLVEGNLEWGDSQHGWLVDGFGQGRVWYTSNGGAAWAPSQFADTTSNFYSIDFKNNQEGWVAGEYGLYPTTDGGAHFAMPDLGFSWIHDLHFIDSQNGFLCNEMGEVAYTQDGGQTWVLAINNAENAALNALSFINPQQGWIVGEYGTILTTNWVPWISFISGNTGAAWATLNYTDGSAKTATSAADGSYSFTVSYNWSGTVTPSEPGYTFTPINRSYTNVSVDQSGQDYTATPITYTLSGNAGVAWANLSYIDGTPQIATADSDGNYSVTVSYNWSGTVTPSSPGYTFSPVNRSYTNILADQTGQDYSPTPVASFADVPTTYWAWNWIERLYSAGITGGCGTSPLIYCPGNPVTRAQMAIFLERGMNGSTYTPPAGTGTVFGDVPISYWADSWIERLYADGITGGCGGGNYCPANPVTRAQMAIFLVRAEYGSSYTPPAATGTVFGDVPASYWAAAWIEQLYADGITGGCGGGNYCPANPVTRAQMAVFLVRTFHLP